MFELFGRSHEKKSPHRCRCISDEFRDEFSGRIGPSWLGTLGTLGRPWAMVVFIQPWWPPKIPRKTMAIRTLATWRCALMVKETLPRSRSVKYDHTDSPGLDHWLAIFGCHFEGFSPVSGWNISTSTSFKHFHDSNRLENGQMWPCRYWVTSTHTWTLPLLVKTTPVYLVYLDHLRPNQLNPSYEHCTPWRISPFDLPVVQQKQWKIAHGWMIYRKWLCSVAMPE